MARLTMLLIGMWIGISLVMLALARLNNHPVIAPELLSQSFYYTAIAFAVYHLVTKRRQQNRRNESEATFEPYEKIENVNNATTDNVHDTTLQKENDR